MSTQLARRVLSIAAVMLIFVMKATAHHSFAGRFDPNVSMEIQGELIEVRFKNPRGLLKVRTLDKGKVVIWELETAGACQGTRFFIWNGALMTTPEIIADQR